MFYFIFWLSVFKIMENLLKNLEDLRERVIKTWRLLDIDRLMEKSEERKAEMNKPEFWHNQERAVAVSKEVEALDEEITKWLSLKKEIRELEELVALANKEDDNSVVKEAQNKYLELKDKFAKLEFLVLFSGPYDRQGAIISLHAGTGGVDAQDWAEILMRMYLRFAEKKGFLAKIIHKNSGNEAGIKNMIMEISGPYAYGYLRGESGVHRLVRISPFDAEAMRHTSFALVEVIPDLPPEKKPEIKAGDLEIDVFKSSGPGGQGVNTTDSAVRIKHLPTNIVVVCQNERSQHQNKEKAMQILQAKLFARIAQQREERERKLRGKAQKAEWGKQIRSYVMQPYKMVKDHRSNYETQDIDGVLNGDLDRFCEEYLRWQQKQDRQES